MKIDNIACFIVDAEVEFEDNPDSVVVGIIGQKSYEDISHRVEEALRKGTKEADPLKWVDMKMAFDQDKDWLTDAEKDVVNSTSSKRPKVRKLLDFQP